MSPYIASLQRLEGQGEAGKNAPLRDEARSARLRALDVGILEQEPFVEQVADFETEDAAALRQAIADRDIDQCEVIVVVGERRGDGRIDFLMHQGQA